MRYKTHCFALQKCRFYTAIAKVLQSETTALRMQKRSYHFLTELSLQSQTYFQRPSQARKGKSIPQKSIDGSVKTAYLIII